MYFPKLIDQLGHVWLLFLKTIIENTILILFENCFCYMNLMFFFYSLCFSEKKN